MLIAGMIGGGRLWVKPLGAPAECGGGKAVPFSP